MPDPLQTHQMSNNLEDVSFKGRVAIGNRRRDIQPRCLVLGLLHRLQRGAVLPPAFDGTDDVITDVHVHIGSGPHIEADLVVEKLELR